MTTSPERGVRSAAIPLLRIVLAVQALRLLLSVVGGVAASVQHPPGDDFGAGPLESGSQRLMEFAGAGGELGAVFMLIAVVLLWATAGRANSTAWPVNYAATSWLLVLTGLSSVLLAAGYLWSVADTTWFPVGQTVRVVGFALVSAFAMGGALFVVRGMDTMRSAPDRGTADVEDEAGAAVFAVDRRTGGVLAWPSMSDAVAKAPLYGVEDDEYEWFLDDGVVLAASAAGQDVTLVATPEARPDDLVRHLKEHAARRGLTIDDEEADEPLAYVDPITRDNYLEHWPHWMRPIGRFFR